MSELSITIKIANREYPLRVKAEDEAQIKEVVRLVNDKIKDLGRKFGLDDYQDLLAMVVFDSQFELLKQQDAFEKLKTEHKNSLTKLDTILNSAYIDQSDD